MSLVEYTPAELVTDIDVMDRLDTATLAELTEAFHTELAHAEQGVQHALSHFIRCGEVLHELRSRVAKGEWVKWCEDQEVHPVWAAQVIRLFVYRDSIDFNPRVVTPGRLRFPSLSSALRSIAGKPPTAPQGAGVRQYPQELQSVAVKMRRDGASYSEISSVLNVTAGAAQRWVNPEATKRAQAKSAQKKREAAAAQAALKAANKRAERDALAKANGKELSVAYAAVRQALAALDRADHSACHGDALQRADLYLTNAETAIVQALQAERQDH